MVNLPPAMEDVSHADIMKHLNVLHSARKASLVAESQSKLCSALKAKNWATTEIEYELGDAVYYTSRSSDKCKEPVSIIGKKIIQ